MKYCRLIIFTSFLVLLFLAGCSVVPPVSHLPGSYQLQALGSIDSVQAFSWHPDSSRYALAANGVAVGNLSGERTIIAEESPAAMAWSPTGNSLAASFIGDAGSTLRIFDGDTGALQAETSVPGQVHDIAWRSEEGLVFASVLLKRFSFGGNVSARLYQWQQGRDLDYVTIADTSPLDSMLDELGEQVYRTVHLRLSPYRDEILFTRLYLTPNAGVRYRLVIHNLDTGKEKEIAKLPLGSRGGRYLADGDTIFYSDGDYQSLLQTIWNTAPYETLAPGSFLDVSPGGRYQIIDRQFLSDRQAEFSFDRIDASEFSPDGNRLLFAAAGKLYLLSGLHDAAPNRLPLSQRLLELRRWRSEGLITPQEFIRYVERLENLK